MRQLAQRIVRRRTLCKYGTKVVDEAFSFDAPILPLVADVTCGVAGK
jgi:hypothetical protein